MLWLSLQQNKEIMCNINDTNNDELKIAIKDIHETYWRCRDFELSHLWQRSIFLSAFLILCFTGYGTLIMELFDNGKYFTYINLLAFAISIVGIIFSCLWIMMGKGSKAWYERYENAIEAFERNNKYTTAKATHVGGFHYGNIPNYIFPPLKKNLFYGNGGAYSPSRINIAIGQITLLVWIITLLFHGIIALKGVDIIARKELPYIVLLGGVIILITFFLIIFSPKIHWLHSSTLNNE